MLSESSGIASVVLCCISYNIKGTSQVIPLPMGKNKILITAKLISSLILSFSVNAGLWYASKKSGLLYAFRKGNLLHSLDKYKLCSHWSHAHLTVSFQIYVKPSTNLSCNLETHAIICITWPAPVHTISNVSIVGYIKHTRGVGWKGTQPRSHK